MNVYTRTTKGETLKFEIEFVIRMFYCVFCVQGVGRLEDFLRPETNLNLDCFESDENERRQKRIE